MAWKVVWSITAARQKDEILKYWVWHNKSTSYSIRLNKLFHQATKLISQNPLLGRSTSYPNVRVKLIRDYLVFYKISERRIEIMMIWDGRRNPKDNPFSKET